MKAGIGIIQQLFSEQDKEKIKMAWKTPKIREIALGAEINSYACAELTA